MGKGISAVEGPARRQRRKAILWLGAALLATALIGLYYSSVWGSPEDFAGSLDEGDRLFVDFTDHFLPTASRFFTVGRPARGYYYSALFALLLAPLGVLPAGEATLLWGVLQVLFTSALLLVPLRFLVRRSPKYGLAYYLLLITSMPVLHSFRWGQVSVLITALVIASFRLHAEDRRMTSALLLALAAAIKYYPALFAVYYLYRRDWRSLKAFAGLLAAFLAAPAVFLGPEGLVAFEREGIGSVLYAPWVSAEVGSLHLPHFLRRLAGVPNSPAVGTLLSGAGLLAAAALILLLVRRGRGPRPVSPERFLCCLFLSLPLVVKTCWQHYFAFLPFCQVLALARLGTSGGISRARVLSGYFLVGASILLSSMLFFNLLGSWWSYSECGCLLAADLMLLPVLLAPPGQRLGA